MKFHFVLLVLSIIFFSCKNDAPSSDATQNQKDSTLVSNEKVVEEIVEPAKTVNKDSIKEVEKTENQVAITKKYGVQWDFCTCIRTLDSINEAFLEDNLSADGETILENRLSYVDNKCKAITTLPSNTEEDRARHQKKVRDCLKK